MDDADLYSEALTRVEELLQRARGTSLSEPLAMSLATASECGRCSFRTRRVAPRI
jgi:pyridoxine/pyridoxamine 5'-phosphate oxidase